MNLEISSTLILELQISHSKEMDKIKEKAGIHLRPVEMNQHPTEAEQVQRILVWMEARTTEENLNLDKELKVEIRKHLEVLMLCLITKGKWINLEIL